MSAERDECSWLPPWLNCWELGLLEQKLLETGIAGAKTAGNWDCKDHVYLTPL